MGNYYLAYNIIAEDHTHTDITWNTEEPQHTHRHGTISKITEGLKQVLPDPTPRP